jgi:hypothetical protein
VRKRIAVVLFGMLLAIAATMLYVPTRWTMARADAMADGSTVIYDGDDPYRPVEFLWVSDGLLYDSRYNFGGRDQIVPAFRSVAWPFVFAEQGAILLVALGAVVFIVRRERRPKATA